MTTYTFNFFLDAYSFCRRNKLRNKPKRVSLYEWQVQVRK